MIFILKGNELPYLLMYSRVQGEEQEEEETRTLDLRVSQCLRCPRVVTLDREPN